MVDELAEALLDGTFAGIVPLAVQGDGNCLFQAASLLALGNEGHHAQLRSIMVSKLEEHAAFYADGFVSYHNQCWNVRPDVHDVQQISNW